MPGISKIEIERTANRAKITIRAARPGIIIGQKGAEIEKLQKEIQKMTQREISINIQEVRRVETDAQLVAENVALQLERRVAFRRAMKKSVTACREIRGAGDQGGLLGKAGGGGDRPVGMVSGRAGSPAYAAGGYRLWLCRSPDHLRGDWH